MSWTAAPASPADVVTLANWAQANGYRLRAKGMSHNWSPIVLPAGNTGAGYVLLDTTQHLTSIATAAGSPATVTVQAGATMDTLTTALAAAGYGLCAMPAPGDITVGGMLAINAHGSAIPGTGETRQAGQTYGSLSNLILSLTAVVWDSGQNQYVLKTFQRSDPDIRPFLAHLGRAFITEVTLQVAQNQNLRCQSWVNQAVANVFAPPSTAGPNSFASYVDASGRIEAIWFPFTDNPWLKIWSIAPTKPALSTKVTSPYNYGFTNSVTTAENTFFQQVATGAVAGTPAFEGSALALVDLGLVFDGVWDIWGQSQDTLLYVKPTTVRIVEAGYAIITSRANIQQVVSDFYAQYTSRLAYYQGLGQFPMNGPIEIRVTGLDQPSEVAVERRPVADPVLAPAPARPPGVGHGDLAGHGHAAGDGRFLPVLRGHGNLDLEPLQRQLRHRAARVVQGLGVHRRRAVDRRDRSRQHHPGHSQRRPGEWRRMARRRVDPERLRPARGVQQSIPGHSPGLMAQV